MHAVSLLTRSPAQPQSLTHRLTNGFICQSPSFFLYLSTYLLYVPAYLLIFPLTNFSLIIHPFPPSIPFFLHPFASLFVRWFVDGFFWDLGMQVYNGESAVELVANLCLGIAHVFVFFLRENATMPQGIHKGNPWRPCQDDLVKFEAKKSQGLCGKSFVLKKPLRPEGEKRRKMEVKDDDDELDLTKSIWRLQLWAHQFLSLMNRSLILCYCNYCRCLPSLPSARVSTCMSMLMTIFRTSPCPGGWFGWRTRYFARCSLQEVWLQRPCRRSNRPGDDCIDQSYFRIGAKVHGIFQRSNDRWPWLQDGDFFKPGIAEDFPKHAQVGLVVIVVMAWSRFVMFSCRVFVSEIVGLFSAGLYPEVGASWLVRPEVGALAVGNPPKCVRWSML